MSSADTTRLYEDVKRRVLTLDEATLSAAPERPARRPSAAASRLRCARAIRDG